MELMLVMVSTGVEEEEIGEDEELGGSDEDGSDEETVEEFTLLDWDEEAVLLDCEEDCEEDCDEELVLEKEELAVPDEDAALLTVEDGEAKEDEFPVHPTSANIDRSATKETSFFFIILRVLDRLIFPLL
jgi:hypothetical protein